MPSHYKEEDEFKFEPITVRQVERLVDQAGPEYTSQVIANVDPPPPEEEKPWWHGVALETVVGIGADLVTAPLLAAPVLGARPLYYGLNYGIGYGTNVLAQKLRGETEINQGEAHAAGGFQTIPLGTTLKGAKGLRRAIYKGAGAGLVGRQVEVGIDEGRALTPGEAISSAGVGAAFGGTFKGIQERKVLKQQLKNQILKTLSDTAEPVYAKTPSDGGRQAKRREIWGPTFEQAKIYRSTLQIEKLENELVLNWGMKDRTFHFDQYKARSANRAKGSADKRKLGAMFESIPYTSVTYDSVQKAEIPRLREFYGPLMEDIGLRPEDFQLHHQKPILASLPGYDGLRFGSDEWWDVTEILFKNGLRPGDDPRNLKPLVGGSKASLGGKFATPHSVTHKYLDAKVGDDGTLFWTQDVRDRMNGVGKWAGKGPDHQFRRDKWQEYSEIVVKSKQITDQAEQTFIDLYARNPALKDVPVDPKEIDKVIERLVKLEEDGLVKPEVLEGTYQVHQMEDIVSEVTERLQESQAESNLRAFLGTRPDEMKKFVDIREIAEDELRELDKLPLSEQLEALQKYTGMTIADIDLLIQTQPNFDPIKFIRENR